MISFKSIFLTLAVAAAGLSLKGEVLYWMVDESSVKDQLGASFTFAYASVKDETTGGYLDYVTEDGEIWAGDYEIPRDLFTAGGVYGNVAGAAGHSFLIELHNDSGALVAWGESGSYGDLAAAHSIVGSTFEQTRPQAWTGGTFTAMSIPEPTSGMMILIGIAGLALRRRRGNLTIHTGTKENK